MIVSTEGDTSPTAPVDAIAQAWRSRAHDLAPFFMRQVNRTDCYGGYFRNGDSVEKTVRPTKPDDRKPGRLNEPKLIAHSAFTQSEHLVGLFTTNPPGNTTANPESNHCRWGLIDIDCHDDSVDPTATMDFAIKLYETVSGMGFNPLLHTSDGRGGYHLRLLFDEPTPSKPLHYFLKSLVGPYQQFGLPSPPEVFPKQPALSKGAYGNWVRLPGKHHKHDHYSSVFTGERWLKGKDAIDFMLAMAWNSPSLIPSLKETKSAAGTSKKKAKPATAQDRLKIVEAMPFLDPSRADNYDDWLLVGMAIHRVFGGSDIGLDLWDEWSRKSGKHEDGEPAKKWATFKPDGDNRIGLGRVIEWAKEDSKGQLLKHLDKLEGVVRNYYEETDPSKSNGDEQTEYLPLTIPCIIDRILECTDGWPRQVAGSLFVHESGSSQIHWLKDPASLFGWLNTRTGPIRWQRDRNKQTGFAAREEVYAELRRTAEPYDTIEAFPHHPPVKGRYYAHGDIQPGNGDKLRELVSKFSPATDADADLTLAVILSLFWGGKPGSTPCFLISSDDGRGAGKTTFAELIAEIVGGSVSITANEDISQFKTRLLSPSALTKRVVILDNLKSRKFSWGELEGLITGKDISGHRLYAGEFCRPNNIVWIITLNGPSLAEDMAQRSVMIKVAKQDYTAKWRNDFQEFLDTYRPGIIADAISMLKQGGDTLANYSRWGAWEQEVLACVPDPSEAQKVIAERRNEINVDNQEVELIEEYFAERLSELGYLPDTAVVGISVQLAAEWYRNATGDRQIKTNPVSEILAEYIDQKKTNRITRDKSRKHGRRWLWYGDFADANTSTANDIDSRLDIFKSRQRGYQS